MHGARPREPATDNRRHVDARKGWRPARQEPRLRRDSGLYPSLSYTSHRVQWHFLMAFGRLRVYGNSNFGCYRSSLFLRI